METNKVADGASLVRRVLVDLVEAVLNYDRLRDSITKIDELKRRLNERVARERRISEDVDAVLHSYEKDEKIETFKIYGEAISSFVKSTLGEYEKKLTELLDNEVMSVNREIEGYRSSSIRSVEAFLSRDPISLLEAEISTRYIDGGYETRYKCKCPKNLEYDFLLDSSEVEILKTRLSSGTLSKGLKLPARIGKTWVSKDPVIDFEKLDDYYLASASLSGTNLFATFTNEGTNSRFKFHSTVSEDASFLEIVYEDNLQNVVITSQPALNSNIEREAVSNMLGPIRLALLFLREHKLRLIRIFLGEVDVIAEMKIPDLVYTILEILSPQLQEETNRIVNDKRDPNQGQDKLVTREFLLERLALLGDRARNVSAFFGL